MNMRWAWIFPVLSSLAVTLVPNGSPAQGTRAAQPAEGVAQPGNPAAPGVYGQAGMMPVMAPPFGMVPPGARPVGYIAAPLPAGAPGLLPGASPGAFPGPMGPVMAPTPDVYGAYGAMPAEYDAETPPDGVCPYCGGQGCEACSGMDCFDPSAGLLGCFRHRFGLCKDLCAMICPYPDGGCAAVRWYDFQVDFMSLQREDAGRNVNIASQGIQGPIVLSTSDLAFKHEPSFRFTGAFQIGPGSNLEFTYYGLFNYSDSRTVTDANDGLFSVFSQFGFLPPGGFQETDASDFQQIQYRSTFDSFEGNFRQRWLAPNCRYQGSWLVGVRHFILDENFRYNTSSSFNGINGDPLNPAQLNLGVDTTNNMTGAQVGGDVWICLLPGLRVGAEGKAAVLGNHANVNTNITVNTGAQFATENLKTNDVAFLADANIMMLYKINYQWTARVGYNLLYVDGVALATENFNTVPPFGPTARVPFLNDNGHVFYHGYSAGLEFMW